MFIAKILTPHEVSVARMERIQRETKRHQMIMAYNPGLVPPLSVVPQIYLGR
jgi:hypothetical protein